MDQKVVGKLEREIELAIAGVVARLGLKKLPLLPSHRTLRLMARAAVAVYEEAVASPDGSSTENQGQE
jgi:hypothetical protein